jgi:hypothetical protein
MKDDDLFNLLRILILFTIGFIIFMALQSIDYPKCICDCAENIIRLK